MFYELQCSNKGIEYEKALYGFPLWASLVAQTVKNPPTLQETQV